MLGIILLTGLIFRLAAVNQSLWLDESIQAIAAQGVFFNIWVELQGDFHPPLYHLIIWVWVHLFDSGEVVLRLPSVIFGLGTVYLVIKIARLAKLNWIFLGLFAATSPFLIYYSQEARPYALSIFLACLSMYYFYKINSTRNSWFLYLLSTYLLVQADYYGWFLVAVQGIEIVWSRQIIKPFIKTILALLVLYFPTGYLLVVQLKLGHQALSDLPAWGNLVSLDWIKAIPLTIFKFIAGRVDLINQTNYLVVLIVVLVLIGITFVRAFKSRLPRIFWFWFTFPLITAWLISFWIPNFQPFRLIIILPAFWFILVGCKSKRLLIILLFVQLAGLTAYYINPRFHREDWRGLVGYLNGNMCRQTLIPSRASYWPFDYYRFGQDSGNFQLFFASSGASPVQPGFGKMLENNYFEKICYVPYLADLFDPGRVIPDSLSAQGFVKIQQVPFNQLLVEEWVKK